MARDLPCNIVVNEMMVSKGGIVEQIHKDELMVNEYTSNEWVGEVINWNCVVIQRRIKAFINFQLFSLNFFICPLFFVSAKCSKPEFAIINISYGKVVTSFILLDFLQLYVFTFDFLFKGSLANI